MGNGHEPLQALGAVDWTDVPKDNLKPYLQDIFDQVLTIIESVPSAANAAVTPATPSGRSRAKTESAVTSQKLHSRPQTQQSIEAAQTLRKDWKEVKVNPKENPLGINVFKLGAKDGKGAWFARQSIHDDLPFDRWKLGLQREFEETMKVQGNPGDGSIRGIGADKNVEHQVVENVGEMSVFQLSAQFPGPTSPRDFVTLLLTSDMNYKADTLHPLKQYIVVSKPCAHSECPQRQGIIRGNYESVEIIREVPVNHSASKRSQSSADLLLPADRRTNTNLAAPSFPTSTSEQPVERIETAVEWLMITRSDPGGSVPRFLIEKGTPPGICGDAGKFLKWIRSKSFNKPTAPAAENNKEETGQPAAPSNGPTGTETEETVRDQDATSDQTSEQGHDGAPISNGLYGIISGIFGTAASVVSTSLPSFSTSFSNEGSSRDSLSSSPPQEDDEANMSDQSSVHSFASALEKRLTAETTENGQTEQPLAASLSGDSKSTTNQPADKEFRRLQEKREKLDQKLAEMKVRMQSKQAGDKEKDEAAMIKMKERYEKDVAKQEAKYKREMKKLEDKREQEARKVERKRAKTIEREEKATLSLELERVRAERDMFQKHMQLLEGQVKDLQASNTTLVAKLGKLGGLTDAESIKRASSEKQ